MTVMKRNIFPLLLIVVGAISASAFPRYCLPPLQQKVVVKRDTLVRTQTIKRTDIILRTDTIVLSDSIYRPDHKDVLMESISGTILLPNAEDTKVQPLSLDSVTPAIPDIPMSPASAETLPVRPGGDYIWVPDSLTGEVATLLRGHSKVVDDEAKIDHSEKVTFRGDTLKMVLRDRNFGRFDRGLFNYLFIPKGIWQFGVTASYGEFETEDLEIFELASDIDLSGYKFSVRPYVSYFIRSNMSLGIRLGYTSGKGSIGSFNVDFDDDINFNLHDITYRSESYTAEVIFSQYFGLARRGRFGVFNEVALALSSGNSDFIRPYGGEPKQTHTSTTMAALNFSPGLSIFIVKEVSFNVSFGVFGFNLKNEKQTENGEKTGNRLTSGMNFRFNIFNINFGISVNI